MSGQRGRMWLSPTPGHIYLLSDFLGIKERLKQCRSLPACQPSNLRSKSGRGARARHAGQQAAGSHPEPCLGNPMVQRDLNALGLGSGRPETT